MKTIYVLFFTSLLVFTANTASAQQPLKLTITAVDAKTHEPRSTFVLGESVAVRVSLTNQSRVARSVIKLQHAQIGLKLKSMKPYEDGPQVDESYYGGTGWATSDGNITFWGSYPPGKLSLAPGETTSVIIADLGRHFFYYPLDEGTYTLTAKYLETPSAALSVNVIFDEAKTVPLLKELAVQPVVEGRDSVQRWAKAVLEFVQHPSIRGYVRDTEGNPLDEVNIEVLGREKVPLATNKSGGYIVGGLREFGTYTITPTISYYDRPGEVHYTLEPASRTITVLNNRITGVDFTATKVRVSKNVASEEEGAKATASSTIDTNFEPENVIDDFRFVDGWFGSSDGWNDGTPNVFPDWLQVDFRGTHRINLINVFTLPDDFKDGRDRELNEKFSQYGITDFDVQYWNGRGWLTVPGGAIRGNRDIWRKISFPPIATDKIRVVILNSIDGQSRITQVEAFHLNDLPQAKIVLGRNDNAKSVATVSAYTNSVMPFRIVASDRDGKIEHYELDFGDDASTYEWHFDPQKPGDKPRLVHDHVYKEPGTYEVKLKVADDSNEGAEAKMIVTVTDRSKSLRSTSRKNTD